MRRKVESAMSTAPLVFVFAAAVVVVVVAVAASQHRTRRRVELASLKQKIVRSGCRGSRNDRRDHGDDRERLRPVVIVAQLSSRSCSASHISCASIR